MKRIFVYAVAVVGLAACGEKNDFNASGTFEATEITVSVEAAGRILAFDAEEGMPVIAGTEVGAIDSLHLQSPAGGILKSRPDIGTQVSSLREQIAKQKTELQRVNNMC